MRRLLETHQAEYLGHVGSEQSIVVASPLPCQQSIHLNKMCNFTYNSHLDARPGKLLFIHKDPAQMPPSVKSPTLPHDTLFQPLLKSLAPWAWHICLYVHLLNQLVHYLGAGIIFYSYLHCQYPGRSLHEADSICVMDGWMSCWVGGKMDG